MKSKRIRSEECVKIKVAFAEKHNKKAPRLGELLQNFIYLGRTVISTPPVTPKPGSVDGGGSKYTYIAFKYGPADCVARY
jgi:hypothetical protein